VKRTLTGLAVPLVALVFGSVLSACTVTPTAATANGDTIAVSTLNARLSALDGTVAGQCLLQLEYPQLASSPTEGVGGPGTWQTGFAGTILSNQVGNLLATQYAATKGITVDAADLASVKSEYESTLDGEIAADVQQSSSSGSASACQKADGTSLTGAELLDGLPADVRADEIRSQAVDDTLLTRGADLSIAAVLNYYAANRSQFAVDCVSDIATSTQAQAEQVVSQLQAGADFGSLARSTSIDTQTASNGGQIGCTFTAARVEQALQVPSVTVGSPFTPVQASGGQWVVYEVTGQTVEPVAAVVPVIRSELLHSTPNEQRVSNEVIAFAHHSEVAVNPQYGTWQGLTVVAPPEPAPQYLLPASSTSLAGAASTGGTGGAGTTGG
jgi:hypothetical protein